MILFALGAHAQGALGSLGQESTVQGIAAIVNDEVISRYDLDQRVGLIVATAGIQPNAENISRIQTQVLRSLVDERLQLQEAERLDIKITDEEIDKALDTIAGRNNMSGQDIKAYLAKNNVSVDALRSQLSSDIAWNKVISQRFGPLVRIGQDEIAEVLSRLESEADQERYQVAEILLTFDNADQEREVSAGAQRLVEQMRAGAPFQAVAQQFSQSPSAAAGGDIGWIRAGELRPELAAVLKNMTPGTISDPIRSLNSFYILSLRDKQSGFGPDPARNQFQLVQVVIPLAPDAPDTEIRRRAKQAETFVKEFKACPRIPDITKNIDGAVVSPVRTVTANQADPQLQAALASLEAGQVAPPRRSKQGIELVAICDRKDDQGGMPTTDAIENSLFTQQLSMMARRHLRDLRRDAVVETR